MTPLTTTTPPEPWAVQRRAPLSTTGADDVTFNPLPVESLDPELVATVLSRIESGPRTTWVSAEDLLDDASEAAH